MHFKSKRSHKKSSIKKIIVIIVFVSIISFIFSYFAFYIPAMSLAKQVKKVEKVALEVKDSFKENDLDKVQKKYSIFKNEFSEFEKSAEKLYWTQYIPILGSYTSDFKKGVLASNELVMAGEQIIISIAPYADLIGFKKSDTTFTNKSAEERIQTAVLTLDKIVDDVDKIAVYVEKAHKDLSSINTNKYPTSLAGKPIRSKLDSILNQFNELSTLFIEAKPFLKSLPEIMGVDKEKTYLILFQNDKELRPTGGFITAYAIFKINQGKIKVERSQDIYSLDNSIRNHPKAPYEIATYHKNVSKLYIRDSNLSPDYKKSVELFDSLYQLSSSKIAYDGVFVMDTKVLVDTLAILGDTEVRGTLFSAAEDKRCDCPSAIYKLLDEIDRPVAYLKEDRKGILGDLLYALMQKALGFSPSQYWGPLSQELFKNLDEKHILLYFKNQKIQKSIEALNYAGRIRDFEGDYLHINDTNFAGAKSNLYVKHKVESKTTINSNGTVSRILKLEYRNPYPHSNCNLEDGGGLGRGGLCINATLRNFIRIYVPKGSTLTSFKGSQKKTRVYEDLGKTVFEGYFTVSPEGLTRATIEYTLPFKLQNTKDYKLLIQKQPGTYDNLYLIYLNDRLNEEKTLVTDHIFTVK